MASDEQGIVFVTPRARARQGSRPLRSERTSSRFASEHERVRVVRDRDLQGKRASRLPVVAPSFSSTTRSGSVACSTSMPIYEYQCTVCGRHVEEIQRFEDPPPVLEDLCPGPSRDDEACGDRTIGDVRSATRGPCQLERVPTTFTQRWDGTYNNDGRAGWQRQGDAMVRVQQGRNSTKYGDGSV